MTHFGLSRVRIKEWQQRRRASERVEEVQMREVVCEAPNNSVFDLLLLGPMTGIIKARRKKTLECWGENQILSITLCTERKDSQDQTATRSKTSFRSCFASTLPGPSAGGALIFPHCSPHETRNEGRNPPSPPSAPMGSRGSVITKRMSPEPGDETSASFAAQQPKRPVEATRV